MAKAQADTKKVAMKSAKAQASKPAKHKQSESARKAALEKEMTEPAGVNPKDSQQKTSADLDTQPPSVVQSGFSVFNQPTRSTEMTDTKTPEHIAKGTPSAEDKEVMAKAKADAAAKASAEKAEKLAAKIKIAEDKALAKQAAASERAAKQAENAARAAERVEGLAASGRNYIGSMTALADRVKQGLYVKSMTGQLRSDDDLARAFDAVPPENVVAIAMKIFGEANKYVALNIGQQSMNYRNRLRGAITKGVEINGAKVTLDLIRQIRDDNGYATGEQEAAERNVKKAERTKKAEDAKAAKLAVQVAKASATAIKAVTPAGSVVGQSATA